MIQRKRNSQERSAPSPLSMNSIATHVEDDDNCKHQRKSKRRSPFRHFNTDTPQFLLVLIFVMLLLLWVNGGSVGFTLRRRPSSIPSVHLLFTNLDKSSSGVVIPRSHYTYRTPDRGDIDPYRSWEKQYHEGQRVAFRRRIHQNDEDHYNKERRRFLYDIDEDDEHWASGFDEHIEEYHSCQPTNWKNKIFPVCNKFHELQRDWGNDKLLGKGYYRAAWKMLDHSPNRGNETYFVFKQLKIPHDDDDWPHLVHVESLFKIQREAIIMERLSASPRIVDIYGHCGTSILSEIMAAEISNQIIPNSGHGDEKSLNALPEVPCNNNFTLQEKIDIALAMAESIADMHGFEGGVMVNGDIHPVQWLWSMQGTVKLNDFNNADLMDWNVETNEFCKLKRGKWGGMYRAPEEFFGTPQDEKIDVYAMGNNIYTLLTGLWPFYEYSRYTTINTKVKAGERPYVDPRYRTHSYGERRLVEIMERMWHQTPELRPEIFEVVAFLRETKKVFELEQRTASE